VKPKLLVIELWQVGDLTIASPFLRKAAEQFQVTVLAKPFALDLRPRFWPDVEVIPFLAPWTRFRFTDKYRLFSWPWFDMARLARRLLRENFSVAVSGRVGDPRDHFLLALTRAKRRLGYPRLGSGMFLTESLKWPDPELHRYEHWRAIAQRLGLDMPPAEMAELLPRTPGRTVVIHTGAGQPIRVWPLERYQRLVARLRSQDYTVRVLCDPDQTDWWIRAGEREVETPASVAELLNRLVGSGAFVGNDSGPGHLAAFLGIPTFTLFGPQLPGWFRPLHPSAFWIEGKPCPFKPCSDYCRFPTPHCLWKVTEEEVQAKLDVFLRRHLPTHAGIAA
jgi:ADP-heptose:LPS heptosyltransferase